MVKRLALLATPFLVHAQVPEADEAAAAAVPAQPLVTYDIVGTFPANVPLTRLTAPGASFLLEVSFPQTVPAMTFETFDLGTSVTSGSYSYEGHTYRVTSGSYSVANHANNAHDLTVATPAGTLWFYSGGFRGPFVSSVPFVGFPVSANHPPSTPQNPWPEGTATFLPVDGGTSAVGAWHYTFTNVRGQQITGYYANVFDVTGRLMSPRQPLATR